jgi:hypothetical protein
LIKIEIKIFVIRRITVLERVEHIIAANFDDPGILPDVFLQADIQIVLGGCSGNLELVSGGKAVEYI